MALVIRKELIGLGHGCGVYILSAKTHILLQLNENKFRKMLLAIIATLKGCRKSKFDSTIQIVIKL